MSTVPGGDTWRDAGLSDPTDATDLIEADEDSETGADGYQPADPRPDLAGAADPADVAEQHAVVPEGEDEDYPA